MLATLLNYDDDTETTIKEPDGADERPVSGAGPLTGLQLYTLIPGCSLFPPDYVLFWRQTCPLLMATNLQLISGGDCICKVP